MRVAVLRGHNSSTCQGSKHATGAADAIVQVSGVLPMQIWFTVLNVAQFRLWAGSASPWCGMSAQIE